MSLENNWLLANAHGYEDLSEEERMLIMHFSLLWSLFEAQVLDNSASANLILNVTNRWNENELLELQDFEEELNYFRNRYISDGEVNNRFEHLHLRNNDNEELLVNVLKNQENELGIVFGSLLIIVYRYRNNFFHGIKWTYNFRGQFENFKHANSLLIKALDIHQRTVGAI